MAAVLLCLYTMIQVLAADIGGTNIRAAVVSDQSNITDQLRSQIDLGDRSLSADQLVDQLRYFFTDILRQHPDVQAIGMGFPGFFLGDTGLLVASPNLPNLHNLPLAEILSEKMNIPVHIQNDALCAAIGEHAHGAGKGASNLLHITLGTGIGGGLILHNLPYTGENGMAMEFGHLNVAQGSLARPCGCGGKGCVEAYASATAIATRYHELSGSLSDSSDVFERACDGDSQAIEIIESAGGYLGAAIAQSIQLLDIHTVSVSGGLTGAWSLLYPAIMRSLNEGLIPPLKGQISVMRSTLADNAGILGAATIASWR